jgi:bla regulator protein blaR1
MMNVFLEALAHLCIVTTVAIVIVLACRIPLRRFAGASLAYASWSLIPIAIAVFLIAKSLPTSRLGLPMPSTMQAPAILVSSAESASRIGLDAALVWLVVWLIGTCVAVGWFAISQYRFVRSLGSLLRNETTATTIPIFRATERSTGPLVLGLFRSRIVIPADFYERYSEAEQQLVIAHELAHIRRGDLYANAFSTALQIAFWFNPLVHWAAQRMRFDQELACDARVLGASRDLADQAKTYAAAVLKTALPKHASPLACHWQSRHPLNERILNMTAPIPHAALHRAAQTGLIALAAASCYGALAFADRTPKPSEGQYRIDILYASFIFDAASNLTQRRSSFSMIQDAGKPAVFKTGNDGGCEYTITITPVKDDIVQVDAPHVCDGKKSRPKIVTQLGKMSSIGGSNTGEPGAAKIIHNVTMVVTR